MTLVMLMDTAKFSCVWLAGFKKSLIERAWGITFLWPLWLHQNPQKQYLQICSTKWIEPFFAILIPVGQGRWVKECNYKLTEMAATRWDKSVYSLSSAEVTLTNDDVFRLTWAGKCRSGELTWSLCYWFSCRDVGSLLLWFFLTSPFQEYFTFQSNTKLTQITILISARMEKRLL